MEKIFFAEIHYPYLMYEKECGVFTDLALAIKKGKEGVEAWLRIDRMYEDKRELILTVYAVEPNGFDIGDWRIFPEARGDVVYSGRAQLKTVPQQGSWRGEGEDFDGYAGYKRYSYTDEFTEREEEIEFVWEEEKTPS